MKILCISVLVFIFAVAAGIFLHDYKGSVHIIMPGAKTPYETDLFNLYLVGLLGFSLSYALVRAFGWLVRIPTVLRLQREKAQARNAAQCLHRALIALLEGRAAEAQQLAVQEIPAEKNLLHLLLAAMAAQELEDPRQRDQYIRRAAQSNPDAKFAVSLALSSLLAEAGELEQAAAICHKLSQQAPDHQQVARLQVSIGRRMRDPEAVLRACQVLRKRRNPPLAQIARAEQAALLMKINTATVQEIQAVWQAAQASAGDKIPLQTAYIRRLLALGAHDVADRQWQQLMDECAHQQIAALYGDVLHGDPERQLERVETLLERNADNAGLLVSAGQLCLRLERWHKAQDYLTRALQRAPSSATYLKLADVLRQNGDQQAALNCYREGLLQVVSEPSDMAGRL